MSSSGGTQSSSSSKDKIDPNEDYYALLGLEADASLDDIRRAYKALARQWHPDRNPERREQAEKMFDRIRKAHDILTDSSAKSEYDVHVHAKRAEKERLEKMNVKRRHLKEELERREKMAKQQRETEDRVRDMEVQKERAGQIKKEGYREFYEEYEKHTRQLAKRQKRQHMTAAAAAKASHSTKNAPTMFQQQKKKQHQQHHPPLREEVNQTVFPMPEGASTKWTIPSFPRFNNHAPSGLSSRTMSDGSDHIDYEHATLIRLQEAAERQREKRATA